MTSWMLGAACAREGLRDLPWTDENASPRDRARMTRVCVACPVRPVCDVYAATAPVPVTAGFWAGRDRTRWTEPDEPTRTTARRPVQDTLPGLDPRTLPPVVVAVPVPAGVQDALPLDAGRAA